MLDTHAALALFARHRCRRLRARVADVVGSNGKTIAKELIRAALAPSYRVHATAGNENEMVARLAARATCRPRRGDACIPARVRAFRVVVRKASTDKR